MINLKDEGRKEERRKGRKAGWGVERKTYRVQVPAARGRVIPEMDSIKEDFPALWEPMTAIWGRSMSTWTLSRHE